jgi:hypothetical protein
MKESPRLVERFPVGSYFKLGQQRRVWRVTDVGARVVVAVAHRAGWMSGPPYAVAETVFDEDDQAVMVPCAEPATDRRGRRGAGRIK